MTIDQLAEQPMPRPRDKAAEGVIATIRDNPQYTYSDIRRLIGESYPRRNVSGEVFEFVLEKILADYVMPRLTKSEKGKLIANKVRFASVDLEEARQDDLTGLPRQKQFLEYLSREMKRENSWRFLMVDLDNFRDFNKQFGHAGGDQALRGFSQLAQEVFNHGNDSLIGRWGGEEFVIAIPGTVPDFQKKVTELRSSYDTLIATTFSRPEKTAKGTFSAGLFNVDFSTDPMTPNDAIKRADEALLVAKDAGRNMTVTWTPQLSGVVK